MATYQTPGVYVEEISTLPPSVAGVSTAIPAFIGTTANHPGGSESVDPPVQVEVVNTLLEFEQKFGKAPPTAFITDAAGTLKHFDEMPQKLLPYAIKHYFRNGGGRCFIVGINNHTAALSPDDFDRGLAQLDKFDEPTLVVMPELVWLKQADFDTISKAALAKCATLKDRFAILDVRAEPENRTSDKDVEAARDGFGADNLAYGAAYHPYLLTALTHEYDEAEVKVAAPEVDPEPEVEPAPEVEPDPDPPRTLASIKASNTALYNLIKRNLAQARVVLPPSAAMAGIYARVDRERGVWKAPANVGVLSTIAPKVVISNDVQNGLNIDPTSGKSINAIRAFAGRGILVWGARTLAGNDNQWRYVNVRRLFIMIEESTQKASAFAVFEPNDANTWLKVKGMIESFLYGLWEQGALQGSTAAAAYYVNVGLGTTMDANDVLEGRMIVEIGIAAVRPAEFIILRFSHLTAQA